ncbi:hypothetical protein L1887_15360 [Cichorium endivia]|nr:hypothetical protein L1887_15360 [Cichorium endivia]
MTGGSGKEDATSTTPNYDSPFYIHPSDYPRQMHVNDVLTDGNYTDWSQEMLNFLFAKNKVGFIDGTIEKPATNSKDYMPWMRSDAMIKGWLNTAMEKEIRTSVKYATTSQEIWEDLKERFGKDSAPKAYELKQSLTATRQEGLSVSAYYTKLRGIWDEIQSVLPMPTCECKKCTCGVGKRLTELQDKERLYEFLLGLDAEFATIRTQILAMQPTPTLGACYHLVAEDEQQRAVTASRRTTNDSTAFQAFIPTKRDQNQTPPKTVRKEGKKEVGTQAESCNFCGREGHKRDGCFKLIGYPDWWPGKGKQTKPKAACVEGEQDQTLGLNEEQYKQFATFFAKKDKSPLVANMAGKISKEGKWIVDSGATVHITYDNSLLEKLSTNRFETPDLSSKALIGMGDRVDGLYKMGVRRQALMTSSHTWHKRLGHVSVSKLSRLDFIKNVPKDFICDSCIKAKFTRLPFQLSTTKTNSCFDLIHCDIWGKYRTPSFTRANYFLTIVDDYSRAVWVFLLKHKHEASACLVSFHKMIQVQFEKKIKRMRCDNGGEFTSNEMQDFYTKEGIVLETTCPHTPQQNGVVERKHRHLLETARALRFEANLPIRFWGECVLAATHLINRLPSDVIENKTPYEILYDQTPDYNHLKVFGCLAYYRSTETKGDKFEVRGRPGVFLGYPPNTKGYKIYDPQHNKIIVSRDVKFVEDVFPFSKVDNLEEENDIFVIPTEWEHEVEVEQRTTEDHSIEEEADQNSPTTTTSAEPHDFTTTAPTETNSSDQNESEGCQRPKRNRSMPAHLNDYNVKLPPSLNTDTHSPSDHQPSTVHPLTHFVSYDKFTNAHKAFLAAITSSNEPKNFSQAMQDTKWVEAMKKEIKALEDNKTWTLQELPKGKRAIDSKWVYKIKYKPNGDVERYKARLVAKGFTQMEGVDYHDTFAPVAKLVTVRTLLAVAVKRGYHIHQLDVNNAFLHGDLHEDVYMKIPQGFETKDDTRVCKLKKSLYGLKQASRNWYQKFTNFLQRLGFRQSGADHSLFLFKEKDTFVAALIYVDDVIILGNDLQKIQATKVSLDAEFSIKDLGPLKFFLGIEVARTRDGMVLSQRKYTLDILEDAGMLGCRPATFPMEQNLKLDKREEEEVVDATQYRRLVGRLLYLQATRPDITYAVNVLSQFVSQPRVSHLEAANRVLRYLKATPGQGILLSNTGETSLTAYCDSDWLGCPLTRRSRTGYLLLLGGSPISWKSKKQSVVSRSSAEAEYRAMASTVSEILWMRWLLQELCAPCHGPTQLFCDNQAARHIANNPVFHERTKHVEMDCHFVRERVESKEIQPMKIDSQTQLADIFTKPLGAQRFHDLLGKLGITNLHAPT